MLPRPLMLPRLDAAAGALRAEVSLCTVYTASRRSALRAALVALSSPAQACVQLASARAPTKPIAARRRRAPSDAAFWVLLWILR